MTTLKEITEEGFTDTGRISCCCKIYEKDTIRAFYSVYKDEVVLKIDLNDLMTKL